MYKILLLERKNLAAGCQTYRENRVASLGLWAIIDTLFAPVMRETQEESSMGPEIL